MSTAEQEIVRVRPWPCAATCDAPGCVGPVSWAVVFKHARPIDTLYLCSVHMDETADNYGWRVDERH